MFIINKSFALQKEVYKLMNKGAKFPFQRLINYTELLHKLKFFTDDDKKEILDKIRAKNK